MSELTIIKGILNLLKKQNYSKTQIYDNLKIILIRDLRGDIEIYFQHETKIYLQIILKHVSMNEVMILSFRHDNNYQEVRINFKEEINDDIFILSHGRGFLDKNIIDIFDDETKKIILGVLQK